MMGVESEVRAKMRHRENLVWTKTTMWNKKGKEHLQEKKKLVHLAKNSPMRNTKLPKGVKSEGDNPEKL